MRIAIFGATGGTGRELVRQALGAGHRVTALVRDPTKLPAHPALTVLRGDVADRASVSAAVVDQDAVLSALGANDRGPTTVCTDGARAIIEAMTAHHVRRLIVLSAHGASDSRDGSFYVWFLRTLLRHKMIDKDHMEDAIKQSGLDWTIVRPGGLGNGPLTQRIQAGTEVRVGLFSIVSRADVARFMLRQLTDPTYVRQAPSVAPQKKSA